MERRLPPVGELAVGSMVLAIVSAIWVAGHIPGRPPLDVSIALLAASAAVYAVTVVTLSRLEAFAWRTFFTVVRWAVVAYVVIAGMIEYAFLYDHTPTRQLVLMTLTLVLFAANVPLILAFGVARYQPAEPR